MRKVMILLNKLFLCFRVATRAATQNNCAWVDHQRRVKKSTKLLDASLGESCQIMHQGGVPR
jgi:hypothetical protein